MSIYAPGVPQPEPDPEEDFDQPEQNAPTQRATPPIRSSAAPRARAAVPAARRSKPIRRSPIRAAQPQPYPAQPAEQVPLGRERMPVTTGAVAMQPAATLACPIVSALDTWFASGVQPAALRWFGLQVAEIRQISAYSCRGMNGQRGAPISEHAFGNALDIASFTLADGRKITVKDGWRGVPEEQGFLRDVHAVGLPAFHHRARARLERVPLRPHPCGPVRRASGRAICNPAAVPGDVVAARAGYRVGARRAGITGSIKQPARNPRSSHPARSRRSL